MKDDLQNLFNHNRIILSDILYHIHIISYDLHFKIKHHNDKLFDILIKKYILSLKIIKNAKKDSLDIFHKFKKKCVSNMIKKFYSFCQYTLYLLSHNL
jgi:hypothetical protein